MIKHDIFTGIISVYEHCNTSTFPIDCEEVLKQYGFNIRKYSNLNKKKLKACMDLSEDATTLDSTVYYNDSKPNGRIRFSLMHELGHIILNTDNESDCDIFSSNLLAPRMAIHYSKCNNANDVGKIFELSSQAANYAYDDYRKWHMQVSLRGMSKNDKTLYGHFYNNKAEKFIWKIQHCDFCYSEDAYNGSKLCDSCKIFEIRKLYTSRICDPLEHDLDIARSNWLYGGL